MCGIVGYIGHRDALQVILSGLEKLEYRGYDSAGVAIVEEGKIKVTRAIGKLGELKKLFATRSASTISPIGIGHTRWATHGRPAEHNAHPHTAGRVSIIHNGIIENYVELREELTREGSVFTSETDTEIAAHLLNRELLRGEKPFDALKETCKQIRGSYAFVALDAEHPDRLLVAKNATPIVIGVGEKEVIVASDITAVLAITRDVIILEDGDIAEIKVDSLFIEHEGKKVTRPSQRITWDPITAQKGGYKHFMLKEIYEQPQVLVETLRGRLNLEERGVSLGDFGLSEGEIRSFNRIVFTACGTAWHSCLVGKFYFESLAGIPCEVDYASEFRYRDSVLDEKTLVIAVSQSGETADTLAAIERAGKRSSTLAVCNVLGSSLSRKVKSVIYTNAGPEISVASTKGFTTQLVSLYLLATHFGSVRGYFGKEKGRELADALLHLPKAASEALKVDSAIEKIAKKFHGARDFLFLGRGACYPIALEGAIKAKELSYIHAEGYPAGEMKHGPIALIDEKMPVVVVLQKSDILFEKTVSNLREVESRGGKIIAITDVSEHKALVGVCDSIVEVPYLSELLSPVILTLPLQLLAYYLAVCNGTDVDQPRNLAKSVTVE